MRLELGRRADYAIRAAGVLRGGPCRWDDMCAGHVPWAEAQYALLDSLEGTTLADLVEIDLALQAGTYELPEGLPRPKANVRPAKGS